MLTLLIGNNGNTSVGNGNYMVINRQQNGITDLLPKYYRFITELIRRITNITDYLVIQKNKKNKTAGTFNPLNGPAIEVIF